MEKKPMFYGGKVGPWIPVLLMLAGMLASTIIGGGGLNRLTGISFFAISVGFLLCKDKKQFGKITLKGLQNPMLGTILMAYLMAGMLAQLLRQSGLITALIWGISKLGMNAGWIPLIGFIACLLISTSCGTSTGSVAAVAPVLLPLASAELLVQRAPLQIYELTDPPELWNIYLLRSQRSQTRSTAVCRAFEQELTDFLAGRAQP